MLTIHLLGRHLGRDVDDTIHLYRWVYLGREVDDTIHLYRRVYLGRDVEIPCMQKYHQNMGVPWS